MAPSICLVNFALLYILNPSSGRWLGCGFGSRDEAVEEGCAVGVAPFGGVVALVGQDGQELDAVRK
jgi:hypothetical protein